MSVGNVTYGPYGQSGYNCFTCGAWVSNGIYHSCVNNQYWTPRPPLTEAEKEVQALERRKAELQAKRKHAETIARLKEEIAILEAELGESPNE